MGNTCRALLIVCCAFLITCAVSTAALTQQVPIDPASTHIFPAGGRRGTTVAVRVGGQCLPPLTHFQLSSEGVKAPEVLGPRTTGQYEPSPRRDPRETPAAYPKEWQSNVEIAADAPLGQKLWRLSSGRGGTGARPFIVGELPELIEGESNSSPQTAQHVSLPVTFNGQIAGERDVDYFQFSASEGETITAEVVAARLGSPLETLIEFHDAHGRRQAAQELRAASDPVLVFRVPTSGDYRLFVSNLSFRGGPEFVYRITLGRSPFVKFAFPPVVQAGASREIELFCALGRDELQKQAVTVLAPPQPLVQWLSAQGATANRYRLDVAELPCLVEHEPNDAAPQANELLPDCIANGQLATASDEDWFRFQARKDQVVSIDCGPAPAGSPALPVVSLLDASGAVLATAKSAEAADRTCRLDWRPSADGAYYLRVADIQQGAGGGAEFVYCLSLKQGHPDFSLAARSDFVNVVQGGRSELELAVARRGGFDQPISLSVEGLPAGVRFEPAEVPPAQNVVKVAFIADDQARPASATLKIVGTATVDGQSRAHSLVATHLGHDADGIGAGPATIGNLQLTVAHKPVFKLYCNEAYQYAYRGTEYPYAMQIERLDGFDGPIHLEVADRQIKDLDGIEVRELTVEPGQTSFKLLLYLPETMHINIQAHSNVYAQGYVTFTDKWGQQQSHLVVSTMRCMVRTLPPVVKLQAVDRALSVRAGGPAPCRLELIRTSNFAGPMQIELVASDASAGITAAPVELPAGATTIAIPLRVDPGAKAGRNVPITFRATGRMNEDVLVVSEAHVTLNFE